MLNPTLYAALKNRFGRVRVENENQRGTPGLNGALQHGEHYRVCCPRCHDSRFRLYVSYTYGTLDLRSRPISWAYCCFNENCEQRGLRLSDYILDSEVSAEIVESDPHPVPAANVVVVNSPGVCRPLEAYRPDHPSHVFLRARGFDPLYMSKRFGVQWCEAGDPLLKPYQRTLVAHRLVFPILSGGLVVGWQVRWVGSCGESNCPVGVPKYYTCPGFHKSEHLYNFDYASSDDHKGYGLVVEGVFDVARIPRAVAAFGHTLSQQQRNMLFGAFQNRALVLCFDRDAYQETLQLAFELNSGFARGCVAIQLPDERDPGDWNESELSELITQQAFANGVQLSP